MLSARQRIVLESAPLFPERCAKKNLLTLFDMTHSEDFFIASRQLFDFSPTEHSLSDLSTDSKRLGEKAGSVRNGSFLAYCWETLAWRISCPCCRAQHGDKQGLLHFAHTLDNQAYRPFCCEPVIEIVSNVTHPVLSEFRCPCLILLAEAVVNVLRKMAITKILGENFDHPLNSGLQMCPAPEIMPPASTLILSFDVFVWGRQFLS
jgi:hypothetical protein